MGQQVTGSGSGGTGNRVSGTANTGASGATGGSSATATGSIAGSGSSGQIVVISTDSYIVNTTVDDTEIGEIEDGDQATIMPTGTTTTDYGTVASVGLIGSEIVQRGHVSRRHRRDGQSLWPLRGLDCGITIIVKQLNNVVEVPTAAISYSTSGQATVTEVNNGEHVVPVTVGGVAKVKPRSPAA